MSKPEHRFRPLLAFAGVLACAAAAAEPKGDPAAQQALRKAQGMLRDLSQQKTQLETENGALKQQLAKLESTVKQLEPLQAEVERDKASIESLRNSADALEGQLGKERERYGQFQSRHREMVAQAKQIQADNQLLVDAVKEREQWIAHCGVQNQDLLKSQRELVEKYKEKGFWDRLAELEPFTGIARVEAENVEQAYRFKLEDLKVTPFQEPAKAAAAPPAEKGEDDADADE